MNTKEKVYELIEEEKQIMFKIREEQGNSAYIIGFLNALGNIRKAVNYSKELEE